LTRGGPVNTLTNSIRIDSLGLKKITEETAGSVQVIKFVISIILEKVFDKDNTRIKDMERLLL
jgi:hypothetical protein